MNNIFIFKCHEMSKQLNYLNLDLIILVLPQHCLLNASHEPNFTTHTAIFNFWNHMNMAYAADLIPLPYLFHHYKSNILKVEL